MKSKGFNSHSKYMILKHALKEDNISLTCKLFGISRTTFYNWKRNYQRYGIAGLENKKPEKPKMPNKVSKAVEEEILTYVVKYPEDGPRRIYYELEAEGISIGETGIYNVLKRHELTRKSQRIKYSMNKELHPKIRKKEEKEMSELLNMENSYPGYLVIQRIDFIGSFDGIGRIYQYTFYDTASKWGEVKIYNRKQDIDIWNYFELKLIYLLRTFNLSIENLITERTKAFLPCFLKGNKHKKIIEDFNINHSFVIPGEDRILDKVLPFNQFLVTEFYNKIDENKDINSFIKVENELNKFVRDYNFYNKISKGFNVGRRPIEIVLERALKNKVDLDTLPLWIAALINSSKWSDKDEQVRF